MGGRLPEGCITGARNTRMEETTWRYRKVEALFEGGPGPAGAVAPYVEGWMDVSSKCFRLYKQNNTDDTFTLRYID